MICTQQKRVALDVRAKNSYSMIAKTIYSNGPRFHHLSDPLGPSLESIALRKAPGQMHKREASRPSSLRAAISEQLKRLIENLALPVPELSPNRLGQGEFLSAYLKILLRK